MTQDTTITDELKACPFCGGPAKLVRHDLDERHSYGREAYVQCLVCKAQTAGFLHDETRGYADRATADPKAIIAWNTRPKETPTEQGEAARDGAVYLIRKHGMFYRPKAQGYTNCAAEAGRYTLEEAISYSHPNGVDGPRDGITYVHESEVPAAHPVSTNMPIAEAVRCRDCYETEFYDASGVLRCSQCDGLPITASSTTEGHGE